MPRAYAPAATGVNGAEISHKSLDPPKHNYSSLLLDFNNLSFIFLSAFPSCSVDHFCGFARNTKKKH